MHPGKKINNKEAQKRFWSGKEEAEKKKQRPSLSTGVKDKCLPKKPQLLMEDNY